MAFTAHPNDELTLGLMVELCEALRIDASLARRIIIDVSADWSFLPKIYVEMAGDEHLLSIDWAEGLKGAQITSTRRVGDDTRHSNSR